MQPCRQPALLAQLVLLPWTPAGPHGQGLRATFEPISAPGNVCKAMHVEAGAEASCCGDEQGLLARCKSGAEGNVRALQNWPHPPVGFGPGRGLRQLLLVQHQSSDSLTPSFQQDWQNSESEIISPSLPEPLENALSSPTLILQLLFPVVNI